MLANKKLINQGLLDQGEIDYMDNNELDTLVSL